MPASTKSAADSSKVKIRWLGHAAFEVESSGGTKLLIDPFISENPSTPDELKKLDRYEKQDRPHAILVSHSHGDHAADAKTIAKKSEAQVIGMVELVAALGIAKDQAKGANIGGAVAVGDVVVNIVPATHSTESGSPVGFVIEFAGGRSLYHTGDTWIMSDMALIEEVFHPDIILTCAGGGPYTMNPKVCALSIEKFFDPSAIVPMHYATFPMLASAADVAAAFAGDARAAVMTPGEMRSF